jgi:hypothetical protein
MPISRKPDAGVPAKRPKLEPAPNGGTHVVSVPRSWLITAAALIAVPWLIVVALYLGNIPGNAGSPATGQIIYGPGRSAASGPWGDLVVTPILISPPLEYIGSEWGGRAAGPDQWFFPGTSVELLDAFLTASGLDGDTVGRLRATARPDAETRGLIVTPDPELVRRLDPQVRARLYGQLAKSRLNFDQANSFRFLGPSVGAWLDGSLISPQTRQLVEPLVYREGGVLHFADVELIRSQVGDVEELRRLAKTLLRQSTVLVRLTVDNASQVDGLVEYWGRGGRRTDLRPLLESLAGAGPERSIDIVHLLPVFARNHLYRYPKITTADFDRPLLANCLWSALNFFSTAPDDRFLDVDVALNSLRSDYYVIESGFQLGDIIAFLDEGGNLFHMAVYLADDMVFSKNGTSPMAPWAIQSIEEIKDYYSTRSTAPRLIYHRANQH